MAKVYSVQPRFKKGTAPGGWSLVDGIFRLGAGDGMNVPPYGTELRDAWISALWANEPMLASVISTWVEKAQTVDWKVTGGRNNARFYATMLANAEQGKGWTWFTGLCALDYLVCDKGTLEELGRSSPKRSVGRVHGIQQVDAARCVRVGKPKSMWRYYPEYGQPVDLLNANIIQVTSVPQGRDRFRGYGYCAISRILEAKQLMLGYITYFRQEIGDLPPELAVIINGLSTTIVEDSLKKYKMDREGRGNSIYPKVWWMGSDNPASQISMQIHSLTTPNKAFNYQTMTEWYIKLLALTTGEDVGEYWLLQSGESKTVQSVQAMKGRGKGVARFLQEKERRYNLDIIPYGTRFEFDNEDDEQDKFRADIISSYLGSLDKMANMGVQRQELVYTVEEIRQMSVEWGVIPAEMAEDEVPAVIGSTLKSLYESTWVVDSNLKEYRRDPLLKGREARQAEELYHWFGNVYMQHKQLDGVEL